MCCSSVAWHLLFSKIICNSFTLLYLSVVDWFLCDEYYPIVHIYHHLCIHLPLGGHLVVSSFGLLKIKILSTFMYESLSGYLLSFLLGMTGSCGRCVFDFLGYCQIIFQSCIISHSLWHCMVAQMVKNLWPVRQETHVWFLDREDSLEKGMATYSSILAWRISWTEEPGLQSVGVQRIRHNWATNTDGLNGTKVIQG